VQASGHPGSSTPFSHQSSQAGAIGDSHRLRLTVSHSPMNTHTAKCKSESESDVPRSLADKKRNAGALKFIFQKLGPGLITGASDDDPSRIATYSQVGAQFAYSLLWTMVLNYPLMTAIQDISARIGRVTGVGITGNCRKNYPKGGSLLRADCGFSG
jgi:hypothetical protein